MRIKSNAKINLFLEVGKRDADGYHFIDSIFQEISLNDTISLEKSDIEDKVVFKNADIKGETTVHKALYLFKERYGIDDKWIITVDKRIPMGAGLGGGSSNAASLLLALADIYGVNRLELKELGLKIGSDVSFFLEGGLAEVKGKGEKVIPLKARLRDVWFVIVYPGIHINTGWAYSELDKEKREIVRMPVFDKNSFINLEIMKKIVYNIFQRVVFDRVKELKFIYEELTDVLDCEFGFMSGSGSSLVFVYGKEEKAINDFERVKNKYGDFVFLTTPVYRE